eukprot:scaffold27129_cov73-Attheya_sp.AAC.9
MEFSTAVRRFYEEPRIGQKTLVTAKSKSGYVSLSPSPSISNMLNASWRSATSSSDSPCLPLGLAAFFGMVFQRSASVIQSIFERRLGSIYFLKVVGKTSEIREQADEQTADAVAYVGYRYNCTVGYRTVQSRQAIVVQLYGTWNVPPVVLYYSRLGQQARWLMRWEQAAGGRARLGSQNFYE